MTDSIRFDDDSAELAKDPGDRGLPGPDPTKHEDTQLLLSSAGYGHIATVP